MALTVPLAGCTGGMNAFFGEAEDADAPPSGSDRSFVFSVAANAPAERVAERLARHALDCWIRGDHQYRVAGPTTVYRASTVALYFRPDAGGAPVEALRLVMTDASSGVVGFEAAGPLASTDYETRIISGARRAARGEDGCR